VTKEAIGSNNAYQSTIYLYEQVNQKQTNEMITCMKVERAKSGFSPTFCFLDCHIKIAQQNGKQIEIVNIIQVHEKIL
jgi:hypothetical protein